MLKELHKKYHTISINAIASFFQVIVTVICYFFLYKYLLKHLGVKELGLWSLIVASTSVVGIGNLGIGGGVLKFVAAADAHKDYKKIKTIVHTGLFTMLPIMALIALILYLILPSILSGVVSHELFPLALQLLPLSLLNLLLGACAGIFSATIDGIQFIYFRNFIAATLTIIYLGLTIFFVPSLGLIGVVYAQIIQTCLMILAYLMIIYWKVPKFSIVRLRTNRNVFRELFGYGINFQIISLSNLFFDPITKYFLSRYGGLSITGYYEMANRLIIQLRSLIVNTMQVIVPAIANIHAKGAVNIKKLYLKWFPFLFLGSLILITYLISLANYISIVWIGRLEESFIVILIIIAFGWFFNIISALAYFIDLGTGDLKWNVVSQVVMTSSNVILCYLFGKIWGGYYIVIGTMFSLIISSIILLIAFNKQFNIQLKELFYPKIWIIIGISLFSIAASYLFYFFANPIISFPLLLAFNFLILTGIMIFNFWRSNLLYKLPSNSLKSENQIN